MGKLGVSLYPEKSSFEKDKAYLALAKQYDFSRIFMNLLLFNVKKNQLEPIIKRMKKTIAYGNHLGFETYLDVNPYTLKSLGISTADLAYFADLGVKGIRLDMGFTGKEEAEMTRNRYGLKIEINMSNEDHYLERIFDYHPNRANLVGCHNFFPQAYTGLSTEYFIHCSKRFLKKNLRTAAFVTAPSAKLGPWELQEGLCTIEAHRNLPLYAQVRHLKALDVVEDIIIGNAYAVENELAEMKRAFLEERLSLTVVPADGLWPIEKKIVEDVNHMYRGDCSEYMIRSSLSRFIYRESPLPARENSVPIQKGDVLILNENYGQYKAELQIALKSRPKDNRVNKIGQIATEDLLLLETLQPYTDFHLTFKRD